MINYRLDWSVVEDRSWWHWALTIPLLAAHLVDYRWACGFTRRAIELDKHRIGREMARPAAASQCCMASSPT